MHEGISGWGVAKFRPKRKVMLFPCRVFFVSNEMGGGYLRPKVLHRRITSMTICSFVNTPGVARSRFATLAMSLFLPE